MAVDYTRLGSYSTTKNDYQKNLEAAAAQDGKEARAARQSRWTSWISLGASIGGGAGGVGAIFGAVAGLIGGGFYEVLGDHGKYNSAQLEAYNNINSLITTNINETVKSQQNRNNAIVSADYLINSTRSNFESTYGKGAFNMLESTIQSLLDMDQSTAGQMKMSSLIGGLTQDEIIGQIETRLMNTDLLAQPLKDENGEILKDDKGNTLYGEATGGRIDRDAINALNSAYIDISSLGNEYVQFLYDKIINSDTEIGDTAKQLSNSEAQSIAQLDQNISELALNNQQKFAELFLNQRSSNISNAQNLGETQASAGASGIRASKASRTSANAQRLQADIANASYGIMLNSYKKSLKADIESNKLSRAQVYYSYRQQMNSLKRQITSSINQSINSYLHGGAELADTIASDELDIDNSMAAVQAGKDFLTENGQTVNDTRKYIYTTNSATA